MNAEPIKQALEEWIESNKDEFVECAMYIHAHPELGMQEFRAHAKLTELAAKHGFTVTSGVAGMPTAFVARYGEGHPQIAFSIEYDCLPGLSQKASAMHDPVVQGGPGHGCGHNLLGTGALLAGVAFRYIMEKFGLSGTIVMFGTPAEELCIGKPFMAREGLFKGVDAFLDWHPVPTNTFVSRFSNAYFNKYYHFTGKAAHGNAPWNGRSALDAGMLMAHAVELLREHISPGSERAANTMNYTFSDTGPEFPSVVPDKTSLWIVGRFNTTETMVDAMERLDACARGTAMATQTTVISELVTAINDKIPNETLAHLVHANYKRFGQMEITEDEQNFVKEMQRNEGQEETGLVQIELPPCEYDSGVSDISEYSWHAPTAMFRPAVFPPPVLHNWKVAAASGSSIGKRAVAYAAKVLSCSAADLVLQPDILKKAKDEHDKRLGGRTYTCLIPDEVQPPLTANKQAMEKYSK
jgi:amidohydrolase